MLIKEDLLKIYYAAIDAVGGKQVVAKEMKQLKYVDKHFHVVAIGKAADAMTQGLPSDLIIDGLVISKHGHFSSRLLQDSRLTCIESDHPTPKDSSIFAGKKLLAYLERIPEDDACLFLISGGASALVEVLQDGWSLEDLSQLTDYLLANAYPINEMNAIRRKISKIKGGGIWNYLNCKTVNCLIISDVPDDNPLDIGSGLLFPAKDEIPVDSLPDKWAMRLKPQATPKVSVSFEWKIIASLTDAKQAAAQKAKELGYQIKVVDEFLDGNAVDVAKTCVNTLKNTPRTLFIWGGETTVDLPADAGKGGRNQHLALAAAIQMRGLQDSYLLSAGTDGSDGLSTATGALVDSKTVENAEKSGLSADEYLKKADSNHFFVATNEVVTTGATGTNVMDLVFAYRL